MKWQAPNGRWGLRGDYRFVSVRADRSAPAFFGQETRYGHRVYGGVIITAFSAGRPRTILQKIVVQGEARTHCSRNAV